MKNISTIHDCYGCGLCATVCGRKIIEIKLNDEGFYEPYITDESRCSDCGLCLEVCAFSHEELANTECKPLASYASWSKDEQVRQKCSSGGVGFEIGRSLIEDGYKVCGVRYDAQKARAEHYIAATKEELIESIGSKYIQSFTVDAFRSVNRKERYLITGTPCQIDSFRRYIRKFRVEDNFILMDFYCHSVPSMLIWKKYLRMAKQKVGNIVYSSWRNKQMGWHDIFVEDNKNLVKAEDKVDWHDSYNLLIKGEKGCLNSKFSEGDIFYGLFLGDFHCNPACQKHCKYKYNKSSADIRIGDLWGKAYKSNKQGVSAVIAFTEKGDMALKHSNCTLIEHRFETVAEGQMKHKAKAAYLSCFAWKMLHSSKTYSPARWKLLITLEKVLHLPQRVVRKISTIISQ